MIEAQRKLEHSLSLRQMLRQRKEDIMEANENRLTELLEGLKGCRYWIFKNNEGIYVFTEKSLFFQSEMPDKSFERFPYFEDYYFHFKKNFIDFSVIGFDDDIYMLLMFEEGIIKPLRINGCYCGDIVIHDYTKINDFHFHCGHAMINNRKCVVVKPFDSEIKNYKLEKIKGNSYDKGLF